ncbi:MAG TPA: DUF2516 family protein [Nocardioides sp.]|uniref:DUF2516 family protein n=1 Tax=Nocardioides sp. TaxID=35761 RepID=UPI002CD49B07|nr:DUF2516 family protein [Nocardioides sp.]HQR27402.1 DUF2516 family protein [Nocardioides sp.]
MNYLSGAPVVFLVEGWIILGISVVLLGVKAFAFVTSLLPSTEEYEAAGKLAKIAWVLILALGLLAQVVLIGFGPIHPIQLGFTVAALVFLADVRPAIAGLRRG